MARTGAGTDARRRLVGHFRLAGGDGCWHRGRIGGERRLAAVSGTRSVRRESLVAGRACPQITIDPADGAVSLDGRRLAADPVSEVPLSRRYLLA